MTNCKEALAYYTEKMEKEKNMGTISTEEIIDRMKSQICQLEAECSMAKQKADYLLQDKNVAVSNAVKLSEENQRLAERLEKVESENRWLKKIVKVAEAFTGIDILED